jgi:hypothetical protein
LIRRWSVEHQKGSRPGDAQDKCRNILTILFVTTTTKPTRYAAHFLSALMVCRTLQVTDTPYTLVSSPFLGLVAKFVVFLDRHILLCCQNYTVNRQLQSNTIDVLTSSLYITVLFFSHYGYHNAKSLQKHKKDGKYRGFNTTLVRERPFFVVSIYLTF